MNCLRYAYYKYKTMKEIWKDIEGWEGLYQVSNLGRVKSLSRHRIVGWADYVSKEKVLKQSTNNGGYNYVWLHKEGKKKIYKIHRLVATAFLSNPNNYKCVNHKDENKANNTVENLEFCNHSYNNNYGTRNEKVARKNGRQILQFSLDGVFLKEWDGARIAGKQLNIRHQSIYSNCKGERKSAGGFIWKYKKQ